ncbi:MAG: zinc ribbon domain-containing protein [Acutalibacteraceae bacterium]|nr:zinc ribbon domain-containing protein [Acutalibacteraceae bacterium]
MICPKCKTQFNGNFCPKCGTQFNQNFYHSGYNSPYNKTNKPIYKKWWFWVILIVIVSVLFTNSKNNITNNKNLSDNKIDINGIINNNACYKVSDSNLIFSQTKDSAFVYYEITNMGDTNLYLKSAVFDIQDKNGHLLQTEDFISSCPDIIQPGEKGYFYDYISFDENVTIDNNSELVPKFEILKANGNVENYKVTDISLNLDSVTGNPKVMGRITNNYSNESDALMYIQTVYYDKNGRVIYIDGTTFGKEIKPNETVSFDSTAYVKKYIDTSKIETYNIIAQNCYYGFLTDNTEAKQIK